MGRKYKDEIRNFVLNLLRADFDVKKIQEEVKNRFNVDLKENVIRVWKHRYLSDNKKKRSKKEVEVHEVEPEEEYEVEKEIIKRKATKTQAKPETAVDRIIRSQIVEEATDKVSDYILIGRELKNKLEEHAKAYGYSNLISFIEFLFNFWDKHKYEVDKIKEFEEKIRTLELENKLLKTLLKPKASKIFKELMKEKAFYEELQLASLLKVLDENFDVSPLLKYFVENHVKRKLNHSLKLL